MNTYQLTILAIFLVTLLVMGGALYNFEGKLDQWFDNIIIWFKRRKFCKGVPMRAKRR